MSATRRRPLWAVTRIVLIVLAWALVAFGAVLWGAAGWIRRTFGPISVDQMLMHLPGAGGAETTGAESGYISTFVLQAIVLPLGLVALLGLLWFGIRAAVRAADRRKVSGCYAVAPRKSVLRRGAESVSRALRLRVWAPALISVGAFTLGGAMFVQVISLPQYVQSSVSSYQLGDYYAVPVVSQSATPRNLVTIYLESMEDAFSDEQMFGEDMLRPITEATSGWDSIDSLRQYEGGGWTMAGIVGTQCGLPLRGTQTAQAGQLDLIGAGNEAYLPGATCLGDVLGEQGYTNVFMGGADAAFASKQLFLRNHGFTEVLDANTWRGLGDEEFSEWGLSDRLLMEHAKDEVDRLHASRQPFNLTMLTLDTHEPSYVFDYCPITAEIEMTSITRCSMEQVAGFVRYLEEQGYLEDTVVVLMGDHEKFISDASNFGELGKIKDRSIFNRIWSPDGVNFERSNVDQLSMFATILDLVGLSPQNGQAGIGVTALRQEAAEGSILALSPQEYSEAVQSRSSDFYAKVWGLQDGEMVTADYFDPKKPGKKE